MQVVEPDFDRRIDLPGAGPCPRPVDIDQTVTGFADLVSLRVYSFAAGVAIHGEAEGDELFVVLMRGAIDLAVEADGRQLGLFSLDTHGGTRAIYMPPGSAYRLTARADADVAYARVRGDAATAHKVEGFAPTGGGAGLAGQAAGMTFVLMPLAAGADLPLPGRDGTAPERLLHLRTEGGEAVIDGQPLGDWRTAALARGAEATLKVGRGAVELLLISAA